jgi:hypothetical protein
LLKNLSEEEKKLSRERTNELMGDGFLRVEEWGKALQSYDYSGKEERCIHLGQILLERLMTQTKPAVDELKIAADAFEKGGKEFPESFKIPPANLKQFGKVFFQESALYYRAFRCFKAANATKENVDILMILVNTRNWQNMPVIQEIIQEVGLKNCSEKLIATANGFIAVNEVENAKKIYRLVAEFEIRERKAKEKKKESAGEHTS